MQLRWWLRWKALHRLAPASWQAVCIYGWHHSDRARGPQDGAGANGKPELGFGPKHIIIIPNLILNYLDYLTRQWSIYICSLSLYIYRYTRKSYICLYPSQKCELPILQHGIPFSHLGQRGKRFAIPWSRVPWCVLAGCWHDLPKHGDVSMG